MNSIALALEHLVDQKVWEAMYIKCFFCDQLKPAKEATVVTSYPEISLKDRTVSQVCEVVCKDCMKLWEKI